MLYLYVIIGVLVSLSASRNISSVWEAAGCSLEAFLSPLTNDAYAKYYETLSNTELTAFCKISKQKYAHLPYLTVQSERKLLACESISIEITIEKVRKAPDPRMSAFCHTFDHLIQLDRRSHILGQGSFGTAFTASIVWLDIVPGGHKDAYDVLLSLFVVTKYVLNIIFSSK